MKVKIIQILIPVCCVALLCSFVGRDPQWFDRRMGELEKAVRIQNEEDKIAELGGFLGVGLQGGMDAEQQQIFDKAQSTLLSIPGHAKYYQNKIESLRAQMLASLNKHDEVVGHWATYDDFRKKAFGVLGLLPSSESVAVLGHFLNDPESRDGRYVTGELIPRSDYQHYPPNCGAAYIAIANLGIENPPGGAKPDRRMHDYDLDQVDAWKDWWNEIKEGRRTYRFIGSSIEYGPDGPASKEVIQRVERDRKRDMERAAGRKK